MLDGQDGSKTYSGNLSILVNGRPTRDFQVQRGSRYGDTMFSLFFLIEAEESIGLANKVVQIRGFRALNINVSL